MITVGQNIRREEMGLAVNEIEVRLLLFKLRIVVSYFWVLYELLFLLLLCNYETGDLNFCVEL